MRVPLILTADRGATGARVPRPPAPGAARTQSWAHGQVLSPRYDLALPAQARGRAVTLNLFDQLPAYVPKAARDACGSPRPVRPLAAQGAGR